MLQFIKRCFIFFFKILSKNSGTQSTYTIWTPQLIAEDVATSPRNIRKTRQLSTY
jgi:hypothetical protein